MRFYLYTLLLSILLITLSPPAQAQETEHRNSGLGAHVRPSDRAAEAEKRWDWPVLREGTPGTQIHLSFDLRNADATIVTNKSFGRARTLAEGRKIAAGLGLPKTDFITYETNKTMVAVDLEFNDYLKKESNTRTRFDFDLARLNRLLEASAFPRPFYYVVENDNGATVTLASDTGETPLTKKFTFFSQSELPKAARLQWTISVPWYGYVLLAGFTAFILGTVIMLPFQVARQQRKSQEKATQALQTIPDPATVQQQYNKMRPMWMTMLLTMSPTLLIVLLFMTGGAEKGLMAAMAALQSLNVSMTILPIAMVVIFAGSQLATFLIGKRAGTAPEPPHPDDPPKWTTTAFIWPMFIALPVMFIAIPGSPFNLMPQVALWLVGIAGGIVVLGAPLISLYARRFTHTTLPPGDKWHDRVQDLAAQAKVKVRRVEVQRSRAVNAYAMIGGTVGLTSALLRQLEPEEIDVIILHELAHHKSNDPRWLLLFSLLTTGVLILIMSYGMDYLEKRYQLSRETRVLLQSPMIAIFVLPMIRMVLMGKSQRKKEEKADRFAVDVTGDPELVIRALTNVHTLSAIPHQLKPSDELLHSHPSLVNRIETIRRYATERGLGTMKTVTSITEAGRNPFSTE